MAGSDSRHPAQPLAPGPSPQSHGDVLFPWASVGWSRPFSVFKSSEGYF